MKPQWIKWYPVLWLHSTARNEMGAGERATFQDFVCLAAISPTPGIFKFVDEPSLARSLNTDLETIKSTMKICLEKNRISIKKGPEGYSLKIIKWGVYQPMNPVNDKPEKEGIKVNFKDDSSSLLSSSLLFSLEEGGKGGERPEIKPAEFIDRKQELERIFKRRVQPIAGRILDYIAELTFEFPDVDWREETEKKIAHLKDNPPGKHANLALQFRNWWGNARRFAAERRRGDRVGAKDPDRDRRLAKFKSEEEALETKYRPQVELAKKEGRQSDLTKLYKSFTMELNKKKKEMGL